MRGICPRASSWEVGDPDSQAYTWWSMSYILSWVWEQKTSVLKLLLSQWPQHPLKTCELFELLGAVGQILKWPMDRLCMMWLPSASSFRRLSAHQAPNLPAASQFPDKPDWSFTNPAWNLPLPRSRTLSPLTDLQGILTRLGSPAPFHWSINHCNFKICKLVSFFCLNVHLLP